MTHKWTALDDLTAYAFYLYGGNNLKYTTISQISSVLGMSEDSFKARMQNIQYELTGYGLSNSAKQTKNIITLLDYSRINDPQFQSNLINYINLLLP